jgi:hypothetical protein
MAFTLLDAEDIAKLQDAYHALDAAELLLEAARDGVIELHGTDPSAAENMDAGAHFP